jgi:hypothetical protein
MRLAAWFALGIACTCSDHERGAFLVLAAALFVMGDE